MGRDRTRQATPDLFSTAPSFGEASPRATKQVSSAPEQRHVLPTDLPSAVRHLDDEELDRLLAAALAEGQAVFPNGQAFSQAATGRSRGRVDAWAGERRSRRLQGWHHALADCPAGRLIPIGCAEGADDRRIGARNHRLKLAEEARPSHASGFSSAASSGGFCHGTQPFCS
jgi:hypothetical protein